MTRRFSDIKRALEYKTGLDNYVDYLTNLDTRQTKRLVGGTRGARRRTVRAALLPFGMDLEAGQYAAVRIGEKSNTAIGTNLGTRLYTSGAQLDGAIAFGGFRPAKLAVFRGTGAATYVPSKITKLQYLKYTGDTYTIPFGALTEAEEEAVGLDAVKGSITTLFAGADILRMSYQPEKVPT